MKLVGAIALVWASVVGVVHAAHDAETPITRVVKLLQGLSKKSEMEGKKEEDLYESFVCWAKTVIDTKTASNSAAESRIDMLKEYIDDIEAGRIEFTSERQDLEKQLETVNAEMEEAKNMRKKEAGEFADAEEEMMQAVAALDKAVLVLKEATSEHKNGVFLEQQARLGLGEGFAARQADAVMLQHAAELGSKALTGGDALFLRKLLTGETPKPDYKKLNRKATFKMDYKARSFKIQDVLTKMNNTFSESLADARSKEKEAIETHDKLMETKGEQKDDLEQSLRDMSEESGARQMNKEEAQEELDSLTEQVANDEKYINQTQTALAEKKGEWKERKELRQQELAAFSKAIDVLYSDDARDLAKKSFASQGFLFIQESTASTKGSAAARALREAAKAAKSSDLAVLAQRVAARTGSHFNEVIDAINKMITDLEAEEETDLKNKEQCEKERAEDTRSAAKKSRSIDEETDAIAKLEKEIDEIEAEIVEKNETIKQATIEMAEATALREKENSEFQVSDAEDKEMKAIVERATGVLTDFYKDNNLMFIQKKAQAPPEVAAGKAPPPPPSTWEAPYGGQTQGATGIITILELVAEDITKDITKAKADEDKAQAEFDEFKTETTEQVASLNNAIVELESAKGTKMETISQKTTSRTDLKALLKAVMKRMADAKPGCDFITINFPARLKNRQVEMDGLEKAKAILMGASFTPEDPNREIKPGDASFLQLKRRL